MKATKNIIISIGFLMLLGIKMNGQNTNLGTNAGNSGSNNTSLGFYAGDVVTGNNNTITGANSGKATITGFDNTFMGSSAGTLNSTGVRNTFLGFCSGYSNTTGLNNVFLGWKAGFYSSTSSSSILIGNEAGFSNNGSNNVFIGLQAGRQNTGTSNVFIGSQAGYNAVGSNMLYIANSNTNTPLIYGEFDSGFVTVNGKLGIGTGVPIGKFQVGTQYRVFLDDNICLASTGWKTNMLGFNAVRRTDGLWETKGDGGSNGGAIIASDNNGGFHFYSFPTTGGETATYTDAQFVAQEKFTLDPSGSLFVTNSLRIGNYQNADAYRLSVDGKIIAEEIVVKMSENWPDYVFSSSYNSRSLEDLELFIKENNHLPNVPSAAEVKENGISIGEMNKILLEKIEENTLYLIELKKQNDLLMKRIEELEKR